MVQFCVRRHRVDPRSHHRLILYLCRFTAVNAVASGLTYFLIDRLGRRTLLLTSLVLMFPLLLGCGYAMDAYHSHTTGSGAVIVIVMIFAAVYSPGAGVSES